MGPHNSFKKKVKVEEIGKSGKGTKINLNLWSFTDHSAVYSLSKIIYHASITFSPELEKEAEKRNGTQ